MIQDQIRAVSNQITPEERAESCVVKSQFTKRISYKIDLFALDYLRLLKKPADEEIEIMSLDTMPSADIDTLYVDSIEDLQTVLTFEQALQKLNHKEKDLLLRLLKMNCDEVALSLGCTTSNVYKQRKTLLIKLKALME